MIVVLVGPSGAGKTTLARLLLQMTSGSRMLGSVTTRSKRDSDLPGEFEYVDQKKFLEYLSADAFEWNVSIHKAQYGTLRTSIDRALLTPLVEIMMLVPSAMEKLWRYADGLHHKVRPFFVNVQSEEVLRERLIGRGDAPDDIEKRIHDCEAWPALIRSSRIPYCVVFNDRDPDGLASIMTTFF